MACEMGLFPDEKSPSKTKWHFDIKWGHSLVLWQLTALLCQSVTYFPIWCLVTVSFIFIQLWITERAYVVSPGAIMWNIMWKEELNAPQPRSDQQDKQVHWLCPLLIPSCLWDWEAKSTKRPNSVYSGQKWSQRDIKGKVRVSNCILKHRT